MGQAQQSVSPTHGEGAVKLEVIGNLSQVSRSRAPFIILAKTPVLKLIDDLPVELNYFIDGVVAAGNGADSCGYGGGIARVVARNLTFNRIDGEGPAQRADSKVQTAQGIQFIRRHHWSGT